MPTVERSIVLTSSIHHNLGPNTSLEHCHRHLRLFIRAWTAYSFVPSCDAKRKSPPAYPPTSVQFCSVEASQNDVRSRSEQMIYL
eukprot:scaffold26478_cov121-Skeletonema_marinoi.AAC.8